MSGNNNRKGLSKSSGDGLATFVKRFWTTPSTNDATRGGTITENMTGTSLSQQIRNTPSLTARFDGALNPYWVEWLMGWPVGWTDIDCDCETICRNVWDWRERQDIWFETETVERVTKRREHRVCRLKAIGNGQVPPCAAAAFETLYRRINET